MLVRVCVSMTAKERECVKARACVTVMVTAGAHL